MSDWHIDTWTPVGESLPDDDSTVLLAFNDGEVWVGYLDAGDWRYVSSDLIKHRVVTHWMHLPAHPSELS